MRTFFAPDISPNDTVYTLNPDESKHALHVLRLKVTNTISIVDGRGGHFLAEISEINKRECKVNITTYTPQYGGLPPQVKVAIAPTKNMDRFEFFLEKATEIGIQEVVPILCDNAVRKHIKQDRLQRILTSAMKQSKQSYLPTLQPLTSFQSFIETPHKGDLFIAHCEALSPRTALTAQTRKHPEAWILIGPEGDFSIQEIKLALQAGFQACSLGSSRLRTETAGIVAVTLLNNVSSI